ncbi:MAG: hypothetical protein ILP02_00330 [Clostridia bacterium]|nr:hypothetical protein [Clostridia bacterium]
MRCFLPIATVLMIAVALSPSIPRFDGSGGTVCYYVGSTSSSCRVEYAGEGDIPPKKGVRGSGVYGVDDAFVKELIKSTQAKKVFSETVEDIVVDYYYSAKIPAYKRVSGKKINLQTARRGDVYTVGSPLIFGGY